LARRKKRLETPGLAYLQFSPFLKPYYFSTQTDDIIIKRSHDLYSTYLDDINSNFPQKMVCIQFFIKDKKLHIPNITYSG